MIATASIRSPRPAVRRGTVVGADVAAGVAAVAAAVALGDVAVELVPRVALAPRLLGGLHRGPAQRLGAGLGERAGARALPGLLDPWGQAGVADEPARGRKTRDVADLGGDREPEQRPDPGNRPAAPRADRRGPAAAARAPAARGAGRASRSPPAPR